MKILHIIDHLGLGGAQRLLKEFFESYEGQHDLYLCSLRTKQKEFNINCDNIWINQSNSKYSFSALIKLKKLIRNESFDILHCHLFKSKVFGWILKKIYFPNIKLIFHEHGQILRKGILYKSFLKLASKEVDLVIAVSKTTKKSLLHKTNLNDDKVKVLYNFVNSSRFKKDKGEQAKNKDGKFIIGFVGRLSKVKNCKTFIKSLKHLDFHFEALIAGVGSEEKELKELTNDLKLEDRVRFLGFVKKIEEIYSKLDLLVIPSLLEPFGLVALEAQTLGIPIVCSKIPTFKEIYKNKENCLFFNTKDHKDLAKKINYLKSNESLIKKLKKNSIDNAKKYKLQNYVKKMNKIYEKI
jgi:glycosyltransferase involved in cell wall biosynthesis